VSEWNCGGRSAVAGIEFESFFYTCESPHLEAYLGHVCIKEEEEEKGDHLTHTRPQKN